MSKGKIGLAVIGLLALFLFLVPACSQTSAAGNPNNVTARQVKISGQLNGDYVSVPVSDVQKNINTRFAVNTATAQMYFMAYQYDNQMYVRADICPPCGSRSFKLTKGTLVCNSCGTVFDAVTGKGKSGYCIRYSKQPVTYQVSGDNIIMKMSDLVTAYRGTLNPG